MSLEKTSEHSLLSYFCMGSNEDPSIFSWCWYIRSEYNTRPTHSLQCLITAIPLEKLTLSRKTVFPVSSSSHLQSLRTLDMIHSTSLRGRQEDEEISSGGIQSFSLCYQPPCHHTKDVISKTLSRSTLQRALRESPLCPNSVAPSHS